MRRWSHIEYKFFTYSFLENYANTVLKIPAKGGWKLNYMKVKESNECFLNVRNMTSPLQIPLTMAAQGGMGPQRFLSDPSCNVEGLSLVQVLYRYHSCCELMGTATSMSHQEDRFQHFPTCLLHSFHLHFLIKIFFNYEISLMGTMFCLISITDYLIFLFGDLIP